MTNKMTPERWQRMNEIFHAALACEAHKREAYLAEACAGDPELLAEVESLLAAHAHPKNFIDAPVYEAAAELVAEAPAHSLIGKQFGAYSVLDQLGAGGMSVVYLAEDTRLGRQVALKLLPTEFSSDPDRLRRFEREARATSSLNHPNIITIYEIGEVEGLHFIATEFVAGQTLRQQMAKGRMELPDVLEVTTQIASALASAHSANVVHRDIKPENVMLRPDGLVKVLDFGLAKLTERRREAGKSPRLPISPYPTLTEPGVVMGTFNYMSPEQARGTDVDARSDLFSLGVVMHELISGQAPFVGETPSDVIAAVLTVEPPPLKHYRPEVPAELQWVVAKALRKDREERYQSSKELFGDLKRLKQEWEFQAKLQDSFPPEARSHNGVHTSKYATAVDTGKEPAVSRGESAIPQPSGDAPLTSTNARPRRGVVLGLAVLLLAMAAFTIWLYQFRRPPGAEILAAARVVPVTALPGAEDFPTFSPDGNQLAFTWDGERGNNIDIYVKLIGAGAPLRLTTDPAEDRTPAWSPDGRYIAFFRRLANETAIYLIPALGGVERKVGQTILNQPALAWTPDGKSLAVTDQSDSKSGQRLFLLSLETLEKRSLTSPPPGFGETRPTFSPDGRYLAFVREDKLFSSGIYLQPAEGGEARELLHDPRLLDGLAWTADSRAIVFSSSRAGSFSLWRLAISGGEPEVLAVAGKGVHNPAISRQSNRLAYNERFIDSNIWSLNLANAAEGEIRRQGNKETTPGNHVTDQGRRSSTKLIFSTRADHSPQFSPDGRRIVFVSDRSGSDELWTCESDGSKPLQLTFFNGAATGSPRWSPDGRQIVFDSRPGGSSDIFVIAVEGGQPRALTTEASNDTLPIWSHDGRWVYFRSNRSGASQIWKMPVSGGPAVQVTQQGAFEACESPDGRSLYYTRGRGPGGIWRVPVEGGEEAPVPELAAAGYWRYWAVGNEGIYFVAKEAQGPPSIKFFSFASRRVLPVAVLDHEPLADVPGLCISPDGRRLLFAQADQSVNDLMLIENFR